MKKFHHDLQLQFYMYDFIYVVTEKNKVDSYSPDTKTFVEKCKKMSTPELVPKYWLGFSYIRSEDYELDINFDETEFKNES